MNLRVVLVGALMVVVMIILPAPARCQVRPWDVSLGAFVGGALPFDTNVKSSGQTRGLPFSFTAKDLTLKDSVSFGGKLTGWWTGLRPRTHLDFGAGLDITRFYPDIKAQTASISGTIGGLPVSGVSAPWPKVGVSSTLVGLNALVRWPLGVTPELPNGRWYPYLGLGGGADIARATLEGSSDTDTAAALQVLGGVTLFLTRHLALFAEYKFTHASHSFAFSGPGYQETDKGTGDVNHLVGGLAWHF